VPKGTLRDRQEDVLSPEVLVRRHAGYRTRVLMGPSFRADVWTALEHAPDLSIADVARKASCSFATAWQAALDHVGGTSDNFNVMVVRIPCCVARRRST